MSERVKMPALGESVTEGTVTRWLKSVGDRIEVDEPLLEVSTDKVDTEIPSPVAGTLEQVLVQEDDTVPVGADLAVIGDGAGAVSDDAASASADGTGSPLAAAAETPGQAVDPAPPGAVGDDSPRPAAEPPRPSDPASVAHAGDEGGQEPARPSLDDADVVPAPSPTASAGTGSSGGSGDGTVVPMPALGESVTEGTVTRWLKQVGDEVAVDEPLLEVSTDKVDTEIPSPVAGTLTTILVGEDDTVPVGADLAVVGGSGRTPAGGASGGGAPDSASGSAPDSTSGGPSATNAAPGGPAPRPASDRPEQASPESAAGQGDSSPDVVTATAGRRAPAPADREQPARAVDAQAPAPAPEPERSGAANGTPDRAASGTDHKEDRDAAAYVTPLVRKLASDRGIDLGSIDGTGIGGRIRKQDVLAAAEAAEAARAAAAVPPSTGTEAMTVSATGAPAARTPAPRSAGTAPSQDTADLSKRGTTETMTRLRRTIARRMVESLQVSAQLTTVVEVDVTRIARLRERAKAEFAAREGTKLSFLPFFALAAVEALKTHPMVNASIEGDDVTYHGVEHLGVAVDTEKGLLVPVLKNAGDLNIGGLAKGIADVAERTRSGKIMPDDLAGGTFTITNTGSRGALFDTPIINQPQVAILGTGSVVRRPVVASTDDGGETIAIRSMVYLALSYDHRLVDGADAARFLTAIKSRLEEGAFEADLGL
ncbi:MAG: 2-oxoglutarate dehydrogenase, E2 component, dihydrolipoamide succinyltransferase [Dermatophilaceae bacterium]